MKAVRCPVCAGTGKYLAVSDSTGGVYSPCYACYGCDGKGRVEVRETLKKGDE